MLNRILGFAVAVLALAACQGPTSVAPVEPGPWEADTLDYVGVWSGPISYTVSAGTEWERLVHSAYIPTTELTVTLPTGYEYSSARLLYCQAELKDFRGSGGSFRDRPPSHACSATLTALGSRPEARLLYPADTFGISVYPKEGDDYPPARDGLSRRCAGRGSVSYLHSAPPHSGPQLRTRRTVDSSSGSATME